MKYVLLLISVVFFASCSSGVQDSPLAKGTGKYPNSTYVSTVTKDLLPPVYGASDSKVHIKIFSDFQCPACIAFHKSIETRLWKEYIDTKKITVSFLNYPLTFTTSTGKPLHPNAEWDALAALCSLPTGKYREYRDALYSLEETKRWVKVTDEERVGKAKELGIDESEFSKCLAEAWYQKTLDSEVAQGDRLKLQGTPSIYLNDIPVDLANIKDADGLFSIIEAALK